MYIKTNEPASTLQVILKLDVGETQYHSNKCLCTLLFYNMFNFCVQHLHNVSN